MKLLRQVVLTVVMGVLATSAFAGCQFYKKTTDKDRDLMWKATEVVDFTQEFYVDQPSYLKISGHIDTEHRGVYIPDKAVMVSLRVKVDGKPVTGSTTGANILNRTDHYQPLIVSGFQENLMQGYHTVQIKMRSASTASDRDGIAQIKPKMSYVLYEVCEY